MQAFPYFGGVIYQPMMPMLFQPDMLSTQRHTNQQADQYPIQHPWRQQSQHYSQQKSTSYQQNSQSSRASNQQGSRRQKVNERQEQQTSSDDSRIKNSVNKKSAPWMSSVFDSSEFKFQYQVPDRDINDVLLADRNKLVLLQQPTMLNSQLNQLYQELEKEDRTNVELNEDTTSSSSSCAIENPNQNKELRRRSKEYRRSMLYEENAPFPRPSTSAQSPHNDS